MSTKPVYGLPTFLSDELIVCFTDGPKEGTVARNVLGKYFVQNIATMCGRKRFRPMTYAYRDAFRGDGCRVITASLVYKDRVWWEKYRGRMALLPTGR